MRIKVLLVGLLVVSFMLSNPVLADSKPVRIGISKIVTHPALDAVEKGIIEVVKAKHPNAIFDLQNANGQTINTATIAQKFNTDQPNIVVGISTPSAQALVNLVKNVPIVFAAVTDPVDAGLVKSVDKGEPGVTGVSDMAAVKDNIKMICKITGAKRIGYIYSSSESNSVTTAKLVKEACAENGLELVENTVITSADIKQAAQAIVDRVDVFYVSTDNTVISAITALTDVAMKANKPVFSEDTTNKATSQVFAALGINYYKQGKIAGDLINQILDGKKTQDMKTVFMKGKNIDFMINLDLAKKLNITVPEDILKTATIIIKDGKTITK